MKKEYILILLLVALCVVAYMRAEHTNTNTNKKSLEAFSTSSCPTSASRTASGEIQIQPGGTKFRTMAEYVDYLKGLYANGQTCIPPKVAGNNVPVDGILGGLGNGVEPPQASNYQGPTRAPNEEMYAKTPIQKLDDYEYTRVFDSEKSSRTPIEAKTTSKLLGDRVLDWANLPFNSEDRANKEDTFVEERMNSIRDPVSGVFFKTASGTDVLPDEATRLREQKVLSAYRPTELTEHRVDSEMEAVGNLVNQMYANDPAWEPVVRKVGESQWEVTELRPRPRKEAYEAEGESRELNEHSTPMASMTIDDRLRNDPYFDKSGVSDHDNGKFWKYSDFTKWTPGLERMFAPTMDNRQWY